MTAAEIEQHHNSRETAHQAQPRFLSGADSIQGFVLEPNSRITISNTFSEISASSVATF